jgi:uncharacterized protein
MACSGESPRLTLNLTHACNMACTYCYAGEKFGSAMSAETGRAAVDLALAGLSVRGAPSLQVAFFGGEPLLAWGRLVDLTDYARAAAERAGVALTFQVTTNGTLLTPDRADTLGRHGFDVALSVDGIPEAHDATRPMAGGKTSGERVWEALDVALERCPSVTVIAVLDPANVAFLGESIEAFVSRGVRRLTLNPNWGAHWADAALEYWREGYERAAASYVEAYRAEDPFTLNVFDDKIVLHLLGPSGRLHACGFGEWDLAVAPSGRLYPCGRAVGEDREPSLVMGDVCRGPMQTIAGPAHEESDLPKPCRGCALRARCASHCGCANREATGDPTLPGDVLCWHERMSIPIADRAASMLFAERNPAFISRFYGELSGGR